MPLLLKVGRADACQIRLTSPNVSSLHAEILVLDDGKVIVIDRNSTNGTYVGNQRLVPGEERNVRRGELVRFADTDLNWAQVPQPENYDNMKTVVAIGSDYRNNLVEDDPFVSRFHAILLVDKKNHAFIRDLGSRNGTIVNGLRIQAHKDVPVKAGDKILLGNKDITAKLAPSMPKKGAVLKWAAITGGIAACVAAIIVGVFFLIPHNGSNWAGCTHAWQPTQASKAVVYITAMYTRYAVMEDHPISDEIWQEVMGGIYRNVEVRTGEIPYEINQSYCATAFFIDDDGRMGTNRHVAVPWDKAYTDPNEIKRLNDDVDEFVQNLLPPFISNYDEIALMNTTLDSNPLWKMVVMQASKEYNAGRQTNPVSYINSLIRQLRKCKISNTGRLVEIKVGYPGRNYTHDDEFERCIVSTVSENPDIDLAILQLNTKKTPAGIDRVFDVQNYYKGELEPLKEKLVWIGYPRGTAWNLDQSTHSLDPQIRETMIAKVPSKYNFEVQGEVQGGASGSPVYNPKNGLLYGVLWGRYAAGATYGQAVQAKYLWELYKKDLGIVSGE